MLYIILTRHATPCAAYLPLASPPLISIFICNEHHKQRCRQTWRWIPCPCSWWPFDDPMPWGKELGQKRYHVYVSPPLLSLLPTYLLIAKSDPYCVFSIVSKHSVGLLTSTQKTSTINNNQNPVWNQSFTFNVSNPDTELLKCKVYDNDPLSFDDEIGMHILFLLVTSLSHPQ